MAAKATGMGLVVTFESQTGPVQIAMSATTDGKVNNAIYVDRTGLETTVMSRGLLPLLVVPETMLAS
jgi:hypothetical protein